jgi:hypothetical protein
MNETEYEVVLIPRWQRVFCAQVVIYCAILFLAHNTGVNTHGVLVLTVIFLANVWETWLISTIPILLSPTQVTGPTRRGSLFGVRPLTISIDSVNRRNTEINRRWWDAFLTNRSAIVGEEGKCITIRPWLYSSADIARLRSALQLKG